MKTNVYIKKIIVWNPKGQTFYMKNYNNKNYAFMIHLQGKISNDLKSKTLHIVFIVYLSYAS